MWTTRGVPVGRNSSCAFKMNVNLSVLLRLTRGQILTQREYSPLRNHWSILRRFLSRRVLMCGSTWRATLIFRGKRFRFWEHFCLFVPRQTHCLHFVPYASPVKAEWTRSRDRATTVHEFLQQTYVQSISISSLAWSRDTKRNIFWPTHFVTTLNPTSLFSCMVHCWVELKANL